MTIQTTNIDVAANADSLNAVDLSSGDQAFFTVAAGVAIQSQGGIGILADSTQIFFIYNNGTVVADAAGVQLADSFDHFYNESGGSVFGSIGVELTTIDETFTNYGDVSGDTYGVNDSGGHNVISNYGTIEGPSAGLNVIAGDVITNSKTGVIDGGIAITSGGDTLTNAGGIDGAITFTGSGNTNSLTNSGEITGAVAFSGGFNTVDNSGLIDGEVSMAHSHDTVTNVGTIDGLLSIPAGSDTVTNAGTIAGQVMFWSTGTGNSLTNAGDIVGDVTLPGSSSLTNSGAIHGNVILSANDTFDISTGLVTGVVDAGASDLFEFSGNFGDVRFDDFTGGIGSTHDAILFAANDFGTFSQVQSASTQVGADVVIKLDATDSITLNNVTLSSLVSADFAFV